MNDGMTLPERPASQRELDQLRAQVEQIDAGGTRGTGVIQTQLSDLIKDVGSLETRLDAHDKQHAQDQRDRAAGRRWTIGTCIAALVLLVAILGLAVDIAGKTR